ncbi:MAG TPA: class I SAM-dependent methyltransferase [Solirubrobacteraceae bacterium]|jgi:SAM-dependent methyltransferase|nr:class I SAM-dependent methyltransferase [Solirubrobacteraceae bacterium]
MHPLHLYADCLRAPTPGEHQARFSDGTSMPLHLERYLGPADATDERLLTDVRGPVLDVGCGPGRHLHALAARGVFALGVDLSPAAVDMARGGGARAMVASIFDELPGAGTWQSALLLDGNIGIGGAPARLLARIGTLLGDDGEVLVELDPPDTATAAMSARIEAPGRVSSWFPWARVSTTGIAAVAGAGGFQVTERWSIAERWFARLSC